MHVNPAAHGPEGLGHHHHVHGPDWTHQQIKAARRECNEEIAHTHDPKQKKVLEERLKHIDDPKFREAHPYNQFRGHAGH